MKKQPIRKMKQVITATSWGEDQNPFKFEKQSHRQPFIIVGNIYSHIIAQGMVINDKKITSYKYITFIFTNILQSPML